MTEPEIIEHEGRRFVRTGKRRYPKIDEWFWAEANPKPVRATHNFSFLEREILRELPAEPASTAQPKFANVTTMCGASAPEGGWLCSLEGPHSEHQAREDHDPDGEILCRWLNTAAQPGEAIRELALALGLKERQKDSSNLRTGPWEVKPEAIRIISEALAPLLEKARGSAAVDPEFAEHSELAMELARWQAEGERK